MRKLLTIILFVGAIAQIHAQDESLGTKVLKNSKSKTYERGEQKSDETVDKALNKVEDKINNLFKKKDKKKKEEQVEENSQEINQNSSNTSNKSSSNSKNVKSNSKFDFVPGEKELYFDNFDRLNTGDFPAEFNTNASGEIVNVDEREGKWLNMTKNGAFIPDNIKQLPLNFTLEFEVGINYDPTNNYSGLGLNFTTQSDDLMKDMFFSTSWSSRSKYLC
jgi:hypothetical protein